MDRPVDPRQRRVQRTRRLLFLALGGGLVGVVFVVLAAWMRPTLDRDRLRTAVVDRGPLEASITASGLVVPAFEQVLSSPTEARVLEVLKRPGALLTPGDPILALDLSADVLALERLDEQIALKENAQLQERLSLEANLIDLESRLEIKRLDLATYTLKSAQNRQLFERHLISEGELRQAELVEQKTAIELKQIEEARLNAERATRARLDGLALELRILAKEQAEARRMLDLATTKSDRAGVLTWVVEEAGTTVRQGDVIARIADLSAFRIEATVSDVHAARLAAGQPARVRINEEVLAGTVSNVLPTVENGIVTVQIRLDDASNPLLRANLRVDVFLVTDYRPNTVRIRKGPAIQGPGAQPLFVLRGDRAVRVPVRLGVSGFEYQEVLEGLTPGEEVILSDPRAFEHLAEVRVE